MGSATRAFIGDDSLISIREAVMNEFAFADSCTTHGVFSTTHMQVFCVRL